jgi:hypothetical protein
MIVGEDMFLDKGKILQLIMQHLYHEGLKHSAHVLSGETNTDCMPHILCACVVSSCVLCRVSCVMCLMWWVGRWRQIW